MPMLYDPRDLLPGHEQFERYWSPVAGKNMWQYDYRDPKGHLYSCVAFSLEICLARRKKWQELLKQNGTP